jgi:hypothetical protein
MTYRLFAGKKGRRSQLFKTEDIRQEYPSGFVVSPITIGEKVGRGKTYTPTDVGAALQQIRSGGLTTEDAALKFHIQGANGGLWTSIATLHSQIEVCTTSTCAVRLNKCVFNLTVKTWGSTLLPLFLQLRMPSRSRTLPSRIAVCLKKLTEQPFFSNGINSMNACAGKAMFDCLADTMLGHSSMPLQRPLLMHSRFRRTTVGLAC